MKRTDRIVKYLLTAMLLVAAGSLTPSGAQRSNARGKRPRAVPAASPCPTPTPAPSPGQASPPLPREYLDAVKDAMTAESNEISRNLVAINEAEPGLRWKGAGADRRVLVLTWTNFSGYDDKKGRGMNLTRYIWVTAVPELKNFCGQLPQTITDPTLRLEQLLGLPPGKGNTKFVEMWAKPVDLFRPSPDPEIVDHEAVLSYPESPFIRVKPKYKKWFEDWQRQSYAGDVPYPWTRLGYTYDWGSRESEMGLSEFVIVEGAMVEIENVLPTLEYCQRAPRP